MSDSGAHLPPAGPLSPAAFYAGAVLVGLAPVLRGGNRHFALIVLETLALAVLVAVALMPRATDTSWAGRSIRLLAASPILIALVQLVPVLPTTLWLKLPGRDVYAQVLDVVTAAPTWRALTVSPDATEASLAAGLPLAAALLLGYFASRQQLRSILNVCVAVALLEVPVALLQLTSAGDLLMFGAFGDAPVGTFGNRNHLGDYLAVCLCCWIWLAWGSRSESAPRNGAIRPAIAVTLLLGLMLSRSRTAIVLGVAGALLCIGLTRLMRREPAWYWHWVPLGAAALLLGLAWLVGVDPIAARFSAGELSGAADFRALLARTTWDAAMAFFPFGSGWGTFDLVYPRFQPAAIERFANHAHMDYVELLLEGGVLFLVFAAVFVVLTAHRMRDLIRAFASGHRASPDAIAASFCGVGAAIVLLHALVDFPLRIPANAVMASLLAGAFLRPLGTGARHRPLNVVQ